MCNHSICQLSGRADRWCSHPKHWLDLLNHLGGWPKAWTDKGTAQEDGLNTGKNKRLVSVQALQAEPAVKETINKDRKLLQSLFKSSCLKSRCVGLSPSHYSDTRAGCEWQETGNQGGCILSKCQEIGLLRCLGDSWSGRRLARRVDLETGQCVARLAHLHLSIWWQLTHLTHPTNEGLEETASSRKELHQEVDSCHSQTKENSEDVSQCRLQNREWTWGVFSWPRAGCWLGHWVVLWLWATETQCSWER